MVWGGSSEAMETQGQLLGRVRRRLAACGTRGGKTWEELFSISDTNRDGRLNYQEFQQFVRRDLRVRPQTVCEYELRLLFEEIDKDNSSFVDSAELVEYMQHGSRRPEDELARHDERISRVRRNMRMAFQALGGSDMDVRKIFAAIDLDSNTRLTQYEFANFVRNELGLSRWDVQNSALNEFYNHIDPNGDGIDLNELLVFLRKQHRERGLVGPQALYTAPKNIPKIERKLKTHKQRLVDTLPRNAMRRSESLPSILTHSFASLGRESPVMMRL